MCYTGVGKDGSSRVTTVIATPGHGPDRPQEIAYTDTKVVGNGSFGVVYQARLIDGDVVAIKKVLQDKRFKNRELQIMRKVEHQNIVTLKYFFYSTGEKKDEVYLNLILEFIPETVYRVVRHYNKSKQTIPMIYVKVCSPRHFTKFRRTCQCFARVRFLKVLLVYSLTLRCHFFLGKSYGLLRDCAYYYVRSAEVTVKRSTVK